MFEYPAVKERRDELKGARKDIEVRLSELDGMEAAMPLFAKVTR